MPVLPEEVRAWLSKAYIDLVAAQVLIEHSRLAEKALTTPVCGIQRGEQDDFPTG